MRGFWLSISEGISVDSVALLESDPLTSRGTKVLMTLGRYDGPVLESAGIPFLGIGGGSTSGGMLASKRTVLLLSLLALAVFCCLVEGVKLEDGFLRGCLGCLGGMGGEGDSSECTSRRGRGLGKGRFLR